MVRFHLRAPAGRSAFSILSLSLSLLVPSGCGSSADSPRCAAGDDCREPANPANPGDPGNPDPIDPGNPTPGGPNPGTPVDPGVSVAPEPTGEKTAKLEQLQAALEPNMTSEEFATRYATSFGRAASYDPTSALGLDLINASPLALDANEMAKLGENGFVISTRQAYPSFVYGYMHVYMADLPVYVSADSILDAVHRSYDDILMTIELDTLIGELGAFLGVLRSRLSEVEDTSVRADLDLYLTVAQSLLEGNALAPEAGASAEQVKKIFDGALSAAGLETVRLFGVDREEDFSQFKPRGHYTEHPDLETYFRAMMWLGRVDFRMLETDSYGNRIFRREQVDAMFAVHALMHGEALEHWSRIDRVIGAFVGESDYMTPLEVPDLLERVGGLEAAAGLSDEELAQAIVDGEYGKQLIASHFIINKSGATLPLNASFALFGQRYVVDSHVLSNVVWARTEAKRMMPNPLDVAFGALGNNQAGALLASEIEAYAYAPNLHGARVITEGHDAEFWSANLYNHWLGALRTLSPGEEQANPASAGLFEVAGTEAWGRRILNTQLASWAELRHDTILYAKQSYTDGAACEFPDGYVDPYPEFYRALGRFADYGLGLAELVQEVGNAAFATRLTSYFTELGAVVGMLGSMAEHQRSGAPFSEAQIAFLNEAVGPDMAGCTTDGSTGWYARLFFDNLGSDDRAPTIADVHTQPTDEGGNIVGHVLHVGTGDPRLMVVTTNTCSGPRAYVGPVFAYHEIITKDFERLDDPAWTEKVTAGASDPPWMAPVLANPRTP